MEMKSRITMPNTQGARTVLIDPPGCGCTDCLTGETEHMTEQEYRLLGAVRARRTTRTVVELEYELEYDL